MLARILKNSSYLLFAQVVSKAIAFFYTIFLARSLGVNNFGLYIIALSYFSLIGMIGDFGVSRYFIRQIVLDRQALTESSFTVAFLRGCLVLATLTVLAVALPWSDPDHTRVLLILVAGVATIPQTIGMTIDNIFTALQNYALSAISALVLSISTAWFGISLIMAGVSSIAPLLALILGEIAYILAGYLLLRSLKLKIRFLVDFALLGRVVKGALPYGLLGAIGLLYFKVDSLLLGYIKGAYDTGIYGVAYKFLEAIVFIPSALFAALFPTLAQAHEKDSQAVGRVYWLALKLLGVLSIPVTLGYVLILPMLIEWQLPFYLSSVRVVEVLSLTIPFMFINLPAVVVLFSTGRYLKPVIYLSLIPLLFNVGLNILLIPAYGYMAAAWITVFSEILSFLLFFQLLYRKILGSYIP